MKTIQVTCRRGAGYTVKADGIRQYSYDLDVNGAMYHVATQGQVYQFVECRWRSDRLVMRAILDTARNAKRLALIRNACAAENARITALEQA